MLFLYLAVDRRVVSGRNRVIGGGGDRRFVYGGSGGVWWLEQRQREPRMVFRSLIVGLSDLKWI